jgi:hypothetical protein
MICCLFGLLSACNEQSSVLKGGENELIFPTQRNLNGRRDIMSALLIGQLVEKDNFLRIQARESETSYIVIWPPNYTFRIAHGRIEVLDEKGKRRVKVGEEVFVDGGETHTVSGIAAISEELQQELSSRDDGPYWIVGAEVRPFEEMESIAR